MKVEDVSYLSRVLTVLAFAAAMGYLEAAVVVYLRALYYPEGFSFPLKLIPSEIAVIEIVREAATIVILLAVAMLAGKRFWERFGYFLILFGVWDIFYYVWLKVALGWPASMFDNDILFLIPLPWIGPVIAPVLISILMTTIGISLTRRLHCGLEFRPPVLSWMLGSAATILILYSFFDFSGAVSKQAAPDDYKYPILVIGLILYGISYVVAVLESGRKKKNLTQSSQSR
ncbi:MAG: hypothetical protein Q8O92_08000 [Candidatus Latescibacter sp.]|nr:hypothetical protein [Candidatus Latescibacter sp.]